MTIRMSNDAIVGVIYSYILVSELFNKVVYTDRQIYLYVYSRY